jgi:hypothetical protein
MTQLETARKGIVTEQAEVRITGKGEAAMVTGRRWAAQAV